MSNYVSILQSVALDAASGRNRGSPYRQGYCGKASGIDISIADMILIRAVFFLAFNHIQTIKPDLSRPYL